MDERLQLILRGIDEGPWDADLQTGEVYCSPRWWQMLGYETNERPSNVALWAEIRHPEDAQRVTQAVADTLKSDGESFQIEYRLRHKQGHYVPVLARAWVLRNAQGKPVRLAGTNTDLTERKRVEAQLQESENRYRALVEWSPIGIGVHQRGLLVYANPAAAAMMGARSAGDLIGLPIIERVHPDFRQHAIARIETSLANGGHMARCEEKFLRLDGSIIDVEIEGTPITHRGEPAIQISVIDITERKKSEATLRESEARFRTLTQLSSDWYWEQDENFRFVLLSGHVAESTGIAPQQHIGKCLWELDALNLSEADWQHHRDLVCLHQEFRDLEIRRPDTDGRLHWASISGTPMFDGSGAFRGYRGIGRDISAQKQALGQIHRLAFYDALTGLPNRRLLLEQLRKALHANARHHVQGALLFIDLDNFKTLNDTLGHDVGDILLQQVAARLKTCVRNGDTVARLGGDEFVVVLEDLEENMLDAAAHADAVGHKILGALNQPYQLAGREHRSSPSIGITLFGAAVQGVDDLLKQADLAMYQAKAAGRNTLRFFDVGMQSEVDTRVALESDLRDGLQGGEELALHFQPIVDVHGQVTGAEALVRWQQPVRGLLMPDEFIPLAESTGLILPLGRWVLQTACEQLARWARRPETAHLTLAVNVSARQLREPDCATQVMQTLHRTGAAPNRLRLELTESVVAHRVEDVIVKMNELKALGVGFSLDDFGTGYSSLSYLKRLPLDLLKIDRSFVRDVLTDPNDAAIARTIVALGHSMGLSVVAEGVETEEQRAFLAASGCLAYQGYLFSRPMPIEQFDAFVAASR
ncbi:EAL domain-containing protein [Rhodoferax sp.]|uniref:sensor domain-containing protein n=1 Tax=Rhodoferax sp. TaxID=50421 RepID=UPI001EC6BF72|nr:EAL domain-containing protein [Rhodoferax sp.]MBT9507087.1 EAL domain-containing protein [Rhodoferax sp.]